MNAASATILIITRSAVNLALFGCAYHQQEGDEKRNQECQQIETSRRGCGGAGMRPGDHGVVRPGGQGQRQAIAYLMQKAINIAGPADCHCGGGDRIFENKRPAHHPCGHLAEYGIGIGIGRTGNRYNGRNLGVNQCCQRANKTSDDKRKHHARPGLLCGDRCEHKDAGPDNRADPKHGEIERAELALESPSSRQTRVCDPAI